MKNGVLPVNEIDNILTHPTIKFNFDAPILYVHVFIILNNNQRLITPKFFTTNEHDIIFKSMAMRNHLRHD
jgi:hypothetical protein